MLTTHPCVSRCLRVDVHFEHFARITPIHWVSKFLTTDRNIQTRFRLCSQPIGPIFQISQQFFCPQSGIWTLNHEQRKYQLWLTDDKSNWTLAVSLLVQLPMTPVIRKKHMPLVDFIIAHKPMEIHHPQKAHSSRKLHSKHTQFYKLIADKQHIHFVALLPVNPFEKPGNVSTHCVRHFEDFLLGRVPPFQ